MRLLTAVAILACVGCVSVGKTVLVPGLPPVGPETVRVFLPDDTPPQHERIAILEADYNDWSNDATDVLNKLRSEAAKLGASGVWVLGSEGENPVIRATRIAQSGVDLGGRVKVQAVAIVF